MMKMCGAPSHHGIRWLRATGQMAECAAHLVLIPNCPRQQRAFLGADDHLEMGCLLQLMIVTTILKTV